MRYPSVPHPRAADSFHGRRKRTSPHSSGRPPAEKPRPSKRARFSGHTDRHSPQAAPPDPPQRHPPCAGPFRHSRDPAALPAPAPGGPYTDPVRRACVPKREGRGNSTSGIHSQTDPREAELPVGRGADPPPCFLSRGLFQQRRRCAGPPAEAFGRRTEKAPFLPALRKNAQGRGKRGSPHFSGLSASPFPSQRSVMPASSQRRMVFSSQMEACTSPIWALPSSSMETRD